MKQPWFFYTRRVSRWYPTIVYGERPNVVNGWLTSPNGILCRASEPVKLPEVEDKVKEPFHALTEAYPHPVEED